MMKEFEHPERERRKSYAKDAKKKSQRMDIFRVFRVVFASFALRIFSLSSIYFLLLLSWRQSQIYVVCLHRPLIHTNLALT